MASNIRINSRVASTLQVGDVIAQSAYYGQSFVFTALDPASLFANGEQGDDFWFWRDFCFTLSSGGVYEHVTTTGDQIARVTGTVNGVKLDQDVAEKRPVYGESGSIGWGEYDGVDDLIRATGVYSAGFLTASGVASLRYTGDTDHTKRLWALGDGSNSGLCAAPAPDSSLRFNDGFQAWDQGVYVINDDIVQSVQMDDAFYSVRQDQTNVLMFDRGAQDQRDNGISIGLNSDTHAPGRVYSAIYVQRYINQEELTNVENLLALRAGVTL